MPSDHRELGRAMDLFSTHPDVGAGLPMWLPDGASLRAELERFAAAEAARAGFLRVFSPVLAKRSLFERSGHWSKFAADMFPPMTVGGEEFVLRPANCPHHALIYAARQRSYRDLPVRLAELAPMFRSELSGVLGGLARVRQINLDDGHVFCSAEQLEAEVTSALLQIERVYGVLGIEPAGVRLSLRGDGPDYLGDPALWSNAEEMLRAALSHVGVDHAEVTGEAAFYGPKIDVQIRDSAGREETLSTVQLDFNQPERFDLRYVAADGGKRRPVMIHRSIMSSMERLAAHLIELYDGAFPVWLAPLQLIAIPVGRSHAAAAAKLVEQAAAAGLRAEVDADDATVSMRIRKAHERRAPYIAVLGDRETAAGLVSLRLRDGRQLGPVAIEDALGEVGRLYDSRAAGLGFGA